MAKVVTPNGRKQPRLFITTIVSLCVIAALFMVRLHFKKEPFQQKATDLGYDYGAKPSSATPELFLELAQSAQEGNRYLDASQIYQFGLRYYPNDIRLWMGLAKVYQILGKRELAIETYKKALSIDPGNAPLYEQLAELLFLEGKSEEALQAIERAVAVNPNNTSYLWLYAQYANLLQKYSLSLDAYERILKIDPHNENAQIGLIKVRAWAKEQPAKNHEEMLLNEVRNYLEKNNNFAAYEAFSLYQILFGNNPKAQLVLAEVLYNQMLNQNPRDAETWYRLAGFYYQYNLKDEGLEAIKHALDIQPKNMAFLRLYLLISTELDSRKDMERAYKSILQAYPQDEEIKRKLILLKLTDNLPLAASQVESHPLLIKTAFLDYECQFIEAIKTLQIYGKEQGKTSIYQVLMTYLADKLTKDQYTCLNLEEDFLCHLVEDLQEIGKQRRDESYLLKERSENISGFLVCMNPCSHCYRYLYISSLRLLEDPPLTDLTAAQCNYLKILADSPWDSCAFKNLARVTSLSNEIDTASALYSIYLSYFPPDKEVLIDYADMLEAQGDIGNAINYLNLYMKYYGINRYFMEKRAHILNSGNLSTPAFWIAYELLQEDCDSYNAWLNYTNATGILHYPYHAVYGLYQLESMRPGDPETESSKMVVLPPLMSRVTAYTNFYQEVPTTLTQFIEGLDLAYSILPDVKQLIGVEAFQTYATSEFNPILGLGDLRGINGEIWGSAEFGWLGLEKILHPKLIADFRIGLSHDHIGGDDWYSPGYRLDLNSKVTDYLDLNYFSSYHHYMVSPRTLSLDTKQWKHIFSMDWRPCWDYQLLAIVDGRINTDSNKQLYLWLYPRHTILFLRHLKIDVGLMFNWLTSRSQVPRGYYTPHLYQAYAAELLGEIKFNDFNSLKLEGTLGVQKDTFNTRFGLLGNIQAKGLFNLSLNWYAEISGEWFYLDTSQGYFYYTQFGGRLNYRY